LGTGEIPDAVAQSPRVKAKIPFAREKIGESLRILQSLSPGFARSSREVWTGLRQGSFGPAERTRCEKKRPSARPEAVDVAHKAKWAEEFEM
jgi:hypothetical protein